MIINGDLVSFSLKADQIGSFSIEIDMFRQTFFKKVRHGTAWARHSVCTARVARAQLPTLS